MIDRTNPFTPDQPVAPEHFTGRAEELALLLTRGVQQTELGKPTAFYVAGEYGIGKSSVAGYIKAAAERDHHLIGLSCVLGGAKTLTDLAERVLQSAVESAAATPSRWQRLAAGLARYVGEQKLFGVTLNLEVLKRDAPQLAKETQLLAFLKNFLADAQVNPPARGVLLIFDEINGIATSPEFAYFLKSLIDSNALSGTPLPLMLLLCGTEERRQALVKSHEPVNRLFTIVDVKPLPDAEIEELYRDGFAQVGKTLDSQALSLVVQAAAGSPKIAHLIGSNLFWVVRPATETIITVGPALEGIAAAAGEFGRQYVDSQILDALRSADYQAMLKKLSTAKPLFQLETSFTRKDLLPDLTGGEAKKLGLFLKRMVDLNVIRRRSRSGEYEWCSQLALIYLQLTSFSQNHPPTP